MRPPTGWRPSPTAHVHPGPYITCVFNPDRALCQPRPDATGRLRPAPPRCQPLACRNVALTPDNHGALSIEAQRLDDELAARPVLPPLLADQLARRRDAITAFLARHTLT